MEERTIVTEIRRHATESPDRLALLVPSRAYRTHRPAWNTWSRATLEHESDAYARGLSALGVRAADRVLVAMHPSLEAYATILGLWKLGAVPAWPDPRMSVREILTFADQVQPRVAIARTRLQGRTASVELAVTVGRRWFWRGSTLEQCRQPGPVVPIVERTETDEAMIVPAIDGGPPLPVILLQPQLRARAAGWTDALGGDPWTRVVHTDPVLAWLDLCLGNTVIVARSPRGRSDGVPVADVVTAIRDHQADGAVASVEAWGDVTRYSLDENLALPSLGTVVVVDGGVAPPLHRRLQRLRRVLDPRCRIVALYGMAEAIPIASIDAGVALGETGEDTTRGRGRCVGRTAPELLVRILAASAEPVHHWSTHLALAAGDVGEIVVGGSAVSAAYAVAEANRTTKIAYGSRTLHRTGQLGTFDDRGRLWVMGAMRHRIQLADGRLIVPEVIEAMFDARTEVERSALVAIGLNHDLLVLCVETPPWQTFGPATERTLREIAARVGCPIVRILPIERLPIDPRGGSVRRDVVRLWVTRHWDEARAPGVYPPGP